MGEMMIKELADELRADLKKIEDRTRPRRAGVSKLTVRHIEDARMRLGKVCQYADDGVSILDK